MKELWIPGLSEMPDVTNVFDMMLLYQEQLDEVKNPDDTQSWHPLAIGALRALSASIKAMPFEDRQISVATDLAVLRNTEDMEKQWEVENVGLRGSLYDVNCIKMGAGALPAISLAMEVESFFDISDPDDSSLIFTSATAPINHVHYIKPDLAA